jgi:hypothetical protein
MLKSAGGYLLVLHTLEHVKDSSEVSGSGPFSSLTVHRTLYDCSTRRLLPVTGICAKNSQDF